MPTGNPVSEQGDKSVLCLCAVTLMSTGGWRSGGPAFVATLTEDRARPARLNPSLLN